METYIIIAIIVILAILSRSSKFRGFQGEQNESVKTIGFMAFSELSKLKKVFFENGVEVIGFNAFSKTSIEELVLPPSIKIIKSFAFYGTPITRVEIPDSVETIEDYAFSNDTVVCGNKGTAAEAYAKLGCSKFELYGNGDTTDETLVTKLEDYLIIDGRLLEYIGTDTEIALPNGIKVIGQSAFPNVNTHTHVTN